MYRVDVGWFDGDAFMVDSSEFCESESEAKEAFERECRNMKEVWKTEYMCSVYKPKMRKLQVIVELCESVDDECLAGDYRALIYEPIKDCAYGWEDYERERS